MLPSFFNLCCRPLARALRRGPRPADGETTFFLGFDADGYLFYKIGNMLGGQQTSVCTEPLVFCPFCGRNVDDAGVVAGAERGAAVAADEEATILTLEVTREIETILALGGGIGASHGGRGDMHATDF